MSDEKKETLGEVLARIDERTKNIEEKLANLVTMDRFLPVERIVYGSVGTALMILLGAVVYSVIPT